MSNIGTATIQVMPVAKGIQSRIEEAISGGSQGFGKALSGALGRAAEIGSAALAGATTAIGAFGASSAEVGATFDKSMSQVAATMGKTMSEMEDEVGSVDLAWGSFSGNMREYAQEMGKNTAFSATEAADALNYMALAGYDTQTSMEMLPNVLNLAAAGSMDLARASDMITDTQTAFGISLERTTQMVDEMAKAASTGNTSVEQLGDAFLVVGGLAQELNGGMVTLADGTEASVDGVQELEIALTAMANAGVKGHEAGTHMRNMLLKLSSPTKDGVAQLEALGVSVYDAEGNMRSLSDVFGDLSGAMESLTQEQKIQAISDLFNTRDIASAEALLNAVNQDWDAIGASILEADGAAQKMADTQLDNLAGDITLFKSALEGAQIAVSDGLTPSLREFVQFGTDGLSKITSAFQEGGVAGAMDALGGILSDGIAMVTEKMPEMIDAGMQLLGALGQGLVDNAPEIFEAIKVVGGQIGNAVGDLLISLTSSLGEEAPRLIPSAIQSILNEILKLLDGDGIDNMVDGAISLMTGLAEGIASAIPIIVEKAPEIIIKLVEAIAENAPRLAAAAWDCIVALAGAIGEQLQPLIDAGKEMIENVKAGIAEKFTSLKESGAGLIENIKAGIVEKIESVKEAFNSVWTVMLENPVVRNIVEYVSTSFENMKNTLSGIWDGIKEYASNAWELIKNVILGPVLLLIDLVTGDFTKLKEDAANIWNNIKEAAIGIWTGLKNAVVSLVTGLWTQVKYNFTTMKDGVIDLVATVRDKAVSLWTNLKEKIVTTAQNLISSVRSKIAELPRIIEEKIGEAVDFIKELPSKALTWGQDLIGNFIQGIKDKFNALKEKLDDVAETIRGYLHFSEPDVGPLKDFHTYAPDMMELFAKGIKDNESLVSKQLNESLAMPQIPTFGSASAGVTVSASGMNGGNVYITVNGAKGQSEERLVEILMDKLMHQFNMQAAVSGVSYAAT